MADDCSKKLPTATIADRLSGLAFRASQIMFALIVAVGGTRYILFLVGDKTTNLAWDAKTTFAASAVPFTISVLLALVATWRIRRAIWLAVLHAPFCVAAWKMFLSS